MSAAETTISSDELIHEIDGDIAVVTLNRPQARNALTFAMYDGLAEICTNMPTDGSVKAMIITGSGEKAFAAGTDMSQFRGFKVDSDALEYEHNMDRVYSTIEKCPVPTIAAISGACTGGGAAIAAAADIRITAANLKFGFPIARTLGNCLSIASLARLSALIGPSRTKEMIFTSRLIEAEEALSLGLVSEVLPDHAAMMERARALAAMLATMAPLTLRATKEGLRRLRVEGAGANDDDLVTMTYMSEDFREGMEAFLGKRKPAFKGR